MQAKSIFFRGDDGGFANRFQHASPLPGHQYSAQSSFHNNRAGLGSMRVVHHQTQLQQQARPGLGMHHPSSERGDFPRPHRKLIAASHDSNDDDGETSSASEDSAPSGGFPSPPPAEPRHSRSFAKRPEPASAFAQEHSNSAKRSRTQHHTERWSPGLDASGVSGKTVARQLPRMAALETLQQHNRDQQQQQPQHNQHHQRQPQQLPQQHRHSSSIGSHLPTSREMAATPMQLPPLSAAGRSPSSAASGLSSTASSPLSSPGSRSTSPSTTFPAKASGSSSSSSWQQRDYQSRRGPPQQHVPQHSMHCNHPPYLQVETVQQQLPAPEVAGGLVLAKAWMPKECESVRQIPRIEALRTEAPSAPTASGAAAAKAAARRWDPVWSKPTQVYSGSFNHTAYAYSGVYPEEAASNGRVPRGARENGTVGSWAMQQEHSFQQHKQQFREDENQMEHAVRQQQQQVRPHPSTSTSIRTSSPVFRQQPRTSASPPIPTAKTCPTAFERTGGKRAWASKNADGRERVAPPSGNQEPDGAGKQILERYLANLNPKASREVWSHDEEEVLWRAQREYGNAWNYISGLLPGRSENAVKNHWYTQMRMFIGQRGNHSSSSKPCPPTSGEAAVKGHSHLKAPKKAGEDTHDTEQHARVNEDEGIAREETEARAEAVAALGMLFSQQGETTVEELDARGRDVSEQARTDFACAPLARHGRGVLRESR